MLGLSRRNQGRGRVHENDVSPRRFLPRENVAHNRCIRCSVSAGKRIERGFFEAELVRIDLVRVYVALTHLGDASRTGDSNFVETIQTMHDKCSMRSQHTKG